ncbi:hypothetical protein MTP99_015877 [Tenebrio molitor]|nr:hypothetical protein MTP99_015877 [Tenebrio molitor]
MAAVLYQEDGGRRRIISYSSARFNPTEMKYHSNEQECLAVVQAIQRYRPYIEDKPFILLSHVGRQNCHRNTRFPYLREFAADSHCSPIQSNTRTIGMYIYLLKEINLFWYKTKNCCFFY